jgi:hypothetical protein
MRTQTLLASLVLLGAACSDPPPAPLPPAVPPQAEALVAPTSPSPAPASEPAPSPAPAAPTKGVLDGEWSGTSADCGTIKLYMFERERGAVESVLEVAGPKRERGGGLAMGTRKGDHVTFKLNLGRPPKPLRKLHDAVFEGDLVEGELRGTLGGESVTFMHKPFVDLPAARGTQHQAPFLAMSGNVECLYAERGGGGTYMPVRGGPELSCDRPGPPRYVRVKLGPDGPAEVFDHVGDASCCAGGPESELPDDKTWAKGPFSCEAHGDALTCKRTDGHGFVLSRTKVELTGP